MLKGLIIATIVFMLSAFVAGGFGRVTANAQTSTPTVTPSPSTTVPSGAPATGHAQ